MNQPTNEEKERFNEAWRRLNALEKVFLSICIPFIVAGCISWLIAAFLYWQVVSSVSSYLLKREKYKALGKFYKFSERTKKYF